MTTAEGKHAPILILLVLSGVLRIRWVSWEICGNIGGGFEKAHWSLGKECSSARASVSSLIPTTAGECGALLLIEKVLGRRRVFPIQCVLFKWYSRTHIFTCSTWFTSTLVLQWRMSRDIVFTVLVLECWYSEMTNIETVREGKQYNGVDVQTGMPVSATQTQANFWVWRKFTTHCIILARDLWCQLCSRWNIRPNYSCTFS